MSDEAFSKKIFNLLMKTNIIKKSVHQWKMLSIHFIHKFNTYQFPDPKMHTFCLDDIVWYTNEVVCYEENNF